MPSADWWDNEFGATALHVQDNPVLALNLAQSSADRSSTIALADYMNQQGGDRDYSDEQSPELPPSQQ
jgi:hypothetical protein